jgi:hypothetical protein
MGERRDPMDQFQIYAQLEVYTRYFSSHPFIGLGMATALLVVYHFLNRKPRLSREVDERLKQLRKERGDYYRTVRTLR